MISKDTIEKLESEERKWDYILGARMRSVSEVRRNVLSRAGRFKVVNPSRKKKKDPSPLKVKEVLVDEHRYIVCHNEEQARKDKADREAIVKALEDQLRRGAKSLVGNKGYRKFLKSVESDRPRSNDKKVEKGFVIDREKIRDEERFDGKWVLRTNTGLSPEECALQYKQLLTVESLFRSVKSLLSTRPIYHKCDETIRGHVFCSFLALVLMKELKSRLDDKECDIEWADVIRDLDRLEEVEIDRDSKRFLLRTETKGSAGKVFQAAGVALPPTVRRLNEDNP